MEFSLLKMLTIMISTIFLNVLKERFFLSWSFPLSFIFVFKIL